MTAPINLDLGRHVYVTDRARAASTEEHMQACLARHRIGDWGIVARDPEDLAANNRRAATGDMVMSAWAVRPDTVAVQPRSRLNPYALDQTLYIVTEGMGAERRTTILLADEY